MSTKYTELDRVEKIVKTLDGKEPAQRKPSRQPTREEAERAAYVVASQMPCLLCDGPPYVANWWRIPEVLAEVPQKVFFSLCFACHKLVGKEKLIEAAIVGMLLQTQGTVH